MNKERKPNVKRLLRGQLDCLKEEFHRVPEAELFRMYLHYMVEIHPDCFNRIVETATSRFLGIE